MRAWSFALASLLLSAGCASPPGESAAHVIGGEATSDFPAVGELVVDGYGVCTVTLVHAQGVLTAAHCVEDDDPSWRVAFELEGERAEVPVATAHPHPDYGDDMTTADVAVLILESAMAAPVPRTMMREPNVGIGDAIRVVGYGVYNEQGYTDGYKRTGHAVVRDMDAWWLHLDRREGEAQPCVGDSGGPYLDEATGAIAGVHTRGNCTSWGTRAKGLAMWRWADWVDDVLTTQLL